MMKTKNWLLRILIGGILAACVFAPEITLGGSFTTGLVEDVTPPQITVAASVTQIDGSGATISWTTSEVADSRVYFGTTAPLVNLAGEIDYSLQHVVRLTKLDPNTTYQYQFVSVDPKGNTTTSSVLSFQTQSVQTQTITFGSLPAPSYAPGGTFSISATSTSSLPVTYSSQTSGVCGVYGSTTPATVQILSAGNCTIQADQAGNSSYSAASSVTQTITIAKGNQIALNATATLDSIPIGGTSQLTVTGGSTLGAVQYQVTSGACQISGNTLTGNGVGLCLVTATMSGNGNYNSVVSTAIPVSVISNQPPIPSPGGPVTATVGGGTLVTGSAAFITPTNPPASQSFPYGVFTFSATTTVGGSITITLTYPQALPNGTRVMKQLNGTWVDWTDRATIAGRVITFTLTDGAYGDTNPAAGVITDPIGPVIPNTPTPTPSPAPIPMLSEWAKISMMLMMIAAVGWYGRRLTL